uniref:Uncharacterized protein n=1 Tax=Oryza sativa subsp. japonica TaxID=39947 RepID=Q6ZCA9_ORYSJ|nr:hypothetical protein [Oryza sativa Japonica Group]
MVTSIGKDSTSGTAPPDLEIKFLPQGSNALPARIKRIGCMDGGMELQKRLCYFAPL